jgi:hypothetical protein
MEAVGNYVGEMPKTIACCCGTSVQGGNAFVLELELLCAFGSNLFRATLSAPSRTTGWQLAPNSVRRSSLLTVRLHRLDFYVVLRKLIAELQAFSQCIQETPMVRFYSSIYADDELLIVS